MYNNDFFYFPKLTEDRKARSKEERKAEKEKNDEIQVRNISYISINKYEKISILSYFLRGHNNSSIAQCIFSLYTCIKSKFYFYLAYNYG